MEARSNASSGGLLRLDRYIYFIMKSLHQQILKIKFNILHYFIIDWLKGGGALHNSMSKVLFSSAHFGRTLESTLSVSDVMIMTLLIWVICPNIFVLICLNIFVKNCANIFDQNCANIFGQKLCKYFCQ